jgi:hypothetical protein
MAEWRVSYGQHTTGPEFNLDTPDLSLTFFRQAQPHELTCTVNATDPSALALERQSCDVWAWRDGVLMFRGPIVDLADTAGSGSSGSEGHFVVITAHSYRERFVNFAVPMRGYPSATHLLGNHTVNADSGPGIGWQLINFWVPITDLNGIVFNGYPGGDPNITPTPSFQPGPDIASTIDTVAQSQPFDWDLVPVTQSRVEYQAWRPQRGTVRPDVVIDWGGSATGFTRDEPTLLANEIWLTTSAANGDFDAYTLTDTPGPEGRWLQIQDGSDTDSGQMPARATNLLADAENPHPAYTFTMAPDWWQGQSHVWLGDQPTCVIKSGRLNVVAAMTVEQIAIAPVDGTEQVSITGNGHPRGKYGEFIVARNARERQRRLRAIEWKQ